MPRLNSVSTGHQTSGTPGATSPVPGGAAASPPPPSAPTPRNRIVKEIIRGLYAGDYAPGQRLSEVELTRRFSASRGPVREALNALAALDLVELTPQRGARIRILRLDEAIDTLVVAQTLIGLAARLASQAIGRPGAAERIASAAAALTPFDPGSASPEFAAARDGFYGALTQIAGNAELTRMLPTVRVHLIRVQFAFILRANDASRHADYRKIAEAVLTGRPSDADTAARAHIGRAIAALTREMPAGGV